MTDLPHVDFEIYGFLHLVWILAEAHNNHERIVAKYVREIEALGVRYPKADA